jgi:hypothetical protein
MDQSHGAVATKTAWRLRQVSFNFDPFKHIDPRWGQKEGGREHVRSSGV